MVERLGVSQIEEAEETLNSINEVSEVFSDPSLQAVAETDVYRLRRGLCLPSSVATCINYLYEQNRVGKSGEVTIGDMYRLLLPFHNQKGLTNLSGETIDKPWWFSTQEGDVYHHVIVAFARGLGVEVEPLIGFDSINQFRQFLKEGGSLAISLDNWFVIKETLDSRPDLVVWDNGRPKVKIEGRNGVEYRRFEPGRHVVSIVKMEGKDSFHCWDSFQLPQLSTSECYLRLTSEEIDNYLDYQLGGKARGIALAKNRQTMGHVKPWINENVKDMVPQEAVEAVSDFVNGNFANQGGK